MVKLDSPQRLFACDQGCATDCLVPTADMAADIGFPGTFLSAQRASTATGCDVSTLVLAQIGFPGESFGADLAQTATGLLGTAGEGEPGSSVGADHGKNYTLTAYGICIGDHSCRVVAD